MPAKAILVDHLSVNITENGSWKERQAGGTAGVCWSNEVRRLRQSTLRKTMD